MSTLNLRQKAPDPDITLYTIAWISSVEAHALFPVNPPAPHRHIAVSVWRQIFLQVSGRYGYPTMDTIVASKWKLLFLNNSNWCLLTEWIQGGKCGVQRVCLCPLELKEHSSIRPPHLIQGTDRLWRWGAVSHQPELKNQGLTWSEFHKCLRSLPLK